MIPALPLAALGGAVGAALRHLLDMAWPYENSGSLPWDLLATNLCGCAVIGYLAGRVHSVHLRAFLLQGLLGGFTSFAGVVWALWDATRRGAWVGCAALVVLGLVAGVASAAWAQRGRTG